ELCGSCAWYVLCTDDGPEYVKADGGGPDVHSVLDVRPEHAGRELRPEGKGTLTAVGERVHFFLYDEVGAFPGGFHKSFRVFEHGSAYFTGARALQRRADGLLQLTPGRDVFRQYVVGAFHGLRLHEGTVYPLGAGFFSAG